MRVVTLEEFNDKGWPFAAQESRWVVSAGPVYLSFTSLSGPITPQPGTNDAEAQRLIRALGGLNFVGADRVEIRRTVDHGSITSLTGAASY
ncbi:arginase family protein [Alsobacter sp. KACC 23698]|uniref:arginase family protein n=1 Tax=Alsobacter sp. KACC 23698 TaxID=3149229 RepID=UPI003877E38F